MILQILIITYILIGLLISGLLMKRNSEKIAKLREELRDEDLLGLVAIGLILAWPLAVCRIIILKGDK